MACPSVADSWRLWFLLRLPLRGLIAVLPSPETRLGVTLLMGQIRSSHAAGLLARTPVLTAGDTLMGAGALFFTSGLVTVQLLFTLLAGGKHREVYVPALRGIVRIFTEPAGATMFDFHAPLFLFEDLQLLWVIATAWV